MLLTLVMTGFISRTGTVSAEAYNPLLNPLLVEFVFGMWLALSWPGRWSSGRWFYVVSALCGMGGAALLLSTTLFLDGDELGRAGYGQGRTLYWGLPAALLVFCMVHLERLGTRFSFKPALKLGDASYTLFLTHMTFIPILAKLWSEIGLDDVLDSLLLVVLEIGFCLMMGLLLHSWIERPAIKTGRKFVAQLFFARRVSVTAN